MRNLLPNAVPKPRPKRKPKPRYSSVPSKSGKEKIAAAKKLKEGNTERQQRVAVVRRQKHAAYRRSACYKAVEKRSGGRCERMIPGVVMGNGYYPNVGFSTRCLNKRSDGLRMTHNHKRYGRQYGGNERPEDIELLCPPCNAQYETSTRPWKHYSKVGSRGKA